MITKTVFAVIMAIFAVIILVGIFFIAQSQNQLIKSFNEERHRELVVHETTVVEGHKNLTETVVSQLLPPVLVAPDIENASTLNVTLNAVEQHPNGTLTERMYLVETLVKNFTIMKPGEPTKVENTTVVPLPPPPPPSPSPVPPPPEEEEDIGNPAGLSSSP
jgi:hypothetical protein